MSPRRSTPVPLDIRLMQALTVLLVAAALAVAVSAGLLWLARQPWFDLRAVVVQGEVTRNNALTLKTNVVPRLSGNFFTADLAQARAAFEAVPWVRLAVVHREFPNRLRAVLFEHHPVAYWGDEQQGTLLNEQGQVFEANVGEVEGESLPRLKGPLDRSAQVLAMYRQLQPLLQAHDMDIEQLELSPRGNWRVLTQTAAALELGHGLFDDVAPALQRFLRTLPQVAAQHGRSPRALLSADLRHPDGYALRLQGVTTLDPEPKKKP